MSTLVEMAVRRSLNIKEASFLAATKGIASVGVIAEGYLKSLPQQSYLRNKQRLFKIFHGKPCQLGTKLASSFDNSTNYFSRSVFSPVCIRMITTSSAAHTKGSSNTSSQHANELKSKEPRQENIEGVHESPPPPKEELSTKEKLKQAVRDYGATVIVFHVTMSLMSLGFFYLLVESGLDVISILAKLGISENVLQSKITEEAGKFVVAYAVHKVFAPLRITITLTATPFIVRKLRGMGILKQITKAKSP